MSTQGGKWPEWGVAMEDGKLEPTLTYLLSECEGQERYMRFLMSQGLHWSDGWINFDTDRFPVINAVCRTVWDEYDSADKWRDQDSVWKFFELGGDDWVDYCGGYIKTAMDILWEYHHRKEG